MKQATLSAPFRFDGVGLHTGTQAEVEVLPAAPDSGITFSLDGVRVPASAAYVVDTSRATVLGRDGKSVSTTEHLLSALFAMGVSNADIVVRGLEIPVRDGSAAEFAAAIAAAGVELQAPDRVTLTLDAPVHFADGDRFVALFPAPEFRVRFLADFPPPVGSHYYYGVVDGPTYAREIAAARTFGYLHEVEALRARGLALGGSLENAIVFAPDGPMQELRWPNEVVRHKVLDLIGDFALLGAWPLCEVVAVKSGHALHARATRELLAHAPEPVTER